MMGKKLRITVFVSFLITVVLVGCSKEENPFGEYEITNISGIDLSSIRKQEVLGNTEKIAFCGIKNNHLWISVFDKADRRLLLEYTYKEEIPESLPLLYGEEFDVVDWEISVYEYVNNLIFADTRYRKVKYVPGASGTGLDVYDVSGPIFKHNHYVTMCEDVKIPNWYENSHIIESETGPMLIKDDGTFISLMCLPKDALNYDDEYFPLSYNIQFFHGYFGGYFEIYNLLTGTFICNHIEEFSGIESNREHTSVSLISTNEELGYSEVCYDIKTKEGERRTFIVRINLKDGNYDISEG